MFFQYSLILILIPQTFIPQLIHILLYSLSKVGCQRFTYFFQGTLAFSIRKHL